jgi:hypothetical protein
LISLKWSMSSVTTPLLAGPVVEQPGQPVELDLLAQGLPLAGRVVGERGHRGEALDELDLLGGERAVRRAIAVERSDDPLLGQHRHAHERLGVVVGAGHDVA